MFCDRHSARTDRQTANFVPSTSSCRCCHILATCLTACSIRKAYKTWTGTTANNVSLALTRYYFSVRAALVGVTDTTGVCQATALTGTVATPSTTVWMANFGGHETPVSEIVNNCLFLFQSKHYNLRYLVVSHAVSSGLQIDMLLVCWVLTF